MLFKSPGKVLENSLNKKLGNLYEPCSPKFDHLKDTVRDNTNAGDEVF